MTEKIYQAAVCNICGGTEYRRVHYFKDWNFGRDRVQDVRIIQCKKCGVRRRMPEIIDDYEAEYHAPYVEQGQSIHPHQLQHFAQLMTARLRQFNARDLSFLDVGCSTGRALKLAATMGFKVVGLDYSRWAADYCAKMGFATRQGSLLGQWPEGEQFDIIHCSHVIEHVPDPVAYLKEMHRLLKPGGHLMLACPNYASLPRLLEREKWIWCLDSHLWQFTARQMRKLLINQGFTIVSLKTYHGLTPNNRWKRRALDLSELLGCADALNIIALKTQTCPE
jgi:2-polyprenyl-3-methyl-5-hydroxy-6-metoxy-1,4-benzoquinol methylase